MEDDSSSLIALTTTIVGAFVGNNSTSQVELPALIAAVHHTLRTIDEPEVVTPAAPVKPTTAQIRKSITPDLLISFEDGRGYKTLKRHLTTRGITLAEYKAKWGLPRDYPTTAPNYSAMRSQMAKSLGLGQVAKQAAKAPAAAKATAPRAKRAVAAAKPEAVAAAPARRGRPKKTPAKA